MKKDIRIIFAGGGTGGHVFPAIYMATYFQKYWGADCQFIGTKKGFESKKVPQSGFLMRHIWISGFKRGFYPENLLVPVKFLISSLQSRKILKETQPHLVIGTGGYVAGPVLRQAVKMGIPTAIQEQNSYPGITTRLLARYVDCVFLAYKDARFHLKKVKRCIISGNPVRETIKMNDLDEARKYFGFNNRLPVILIFGGSQGARNINQAVAKILDKTLLSDVQLIWQTGTIEFDYYKERYKDYNLLNLCILPFIDRMDFAYAISAFAVTRAGAMTISELAAAALPAILIPYPFAAGDHQSRNAQSIVKGEGALLIEDNPDLSASLHGAIQELLAHPQKLKSMASRIHQFHNYHTMELIAAEAARLIETNHPNLYGQLTAASKNLPQAGN
jgi:UDP-N-acetylglucosamine--N-acetylmuramyl-(pentapeptide) pyrophosphoryl-undecaprenol N-acetylglucosamine transferase